MPSPKKQPYHLSDEGTFKFWRIDQPKAANLLKEIIYRWRASSAKIPGKPGKWTVYPINRWAEWTGLPRRTAQTKISDLAEMGLILREQHTFAGPGVHVYFQPTSLALKWMGNDDEKARARKALAIQNGAMDGAMDGAMVGAMVGANITTTSTTSTLSTKTTNPISCVHADAEPEGWVDGKEAKIENAFQADLKTPAPLFAGVQLADVWKTSMAKVYPEAVVILTAAEIKNLKTKQNGYAKHHPALAPYFGDVLDYAIKNWSKFLDVAETKGGAFNFPDEPTVAFFVKFHAFAFALWKYEHNLSSKDGVLAPKVLGPAIQPTASLAPKTTLPATTPASTSDKAPSATAAPAKGIANIQAMFTKPQLSPPKLSPQLQQPKPEDEILTGEAAIKFMLELSNAPDDDE